MDMIFDTAAGQLSIDTTDVRPWGANLRAVLHRHGHRINLHGVEMRLTITADGEVVFDMALPPEGVHYKQTDQDVLATGRVKWSPDQQIVVDAWCRTNSGHEVTAQVAFTSPRPPQPYPSWTWENGRWTPPLPMPDEGEWWWDDAAGEWLPIDSETGA